MDKNLMKGFGKYFFSISKPYKYIIFSLILLVLFSGVLAGLPYRPLINAETYPCYYRLLAFYNGIANATVGFIALILGPIAGLIAGFFETILTLIFKIGFFRGRVYVGLDNFELFADESVYFFFMYALFGLVTGLCFHIMKLKTNISFKKIVVINSIIIFFNLIINHLIFSTIYYENNINQRLYGVMSWGVSGAGGIFRKYFSNLLDREWYYIGTILTKPPVHIIIIECVTMVAIGTLFILYYRKAMERRINMSDNFNEKVNEVKDKAKETLNAGKDKVNEKIKGLALRGILEKKIPAETRAKLPILDKLLPLTNYIACGLAVVLVVIIMMAVFSKKTNTLVGQWEYWSGDIVWFFGKSSSIVFLSDGTVIERDGGNSGNWISSSGEQLTVIEEDDVFYFTYKVQDNMLTIVDSDGDKIVYERRTGREASGTATSSQSSRTPTMLSGTFSTILRLGSSSERLYYTFNTNGTYVYGTGYAGAVRTGTYTVSGDTVTLSGGETFTIVNSNTLSSGNSLWTK